MKVGMLCETLLSIVAGAPYWGNVLYSAAILRIRAACIESLSK